MAEHRNGKGPDVNYSITFYDHNWEELTLFNLSHIDRAQLEDVLDEWQDAHLKAATTFLGQVEPITMSKYIGIEVHHGD